MSQHGGELPSSDLDALQGELAHLRASIAAERTALQAEMDALRQQNTQLHDRLEQERRERARLEVELSASEARYEALTEVLLETSADGIVLLDANGDVIEANSSFARMLGYTPAEVAQLNLVDWDAHWSEEELQQKVADASLCENRFETRHRRKDGSLYEVEICSNAVEWEDGQTLHFCICRDITERKQLELTLQASERQLNDVLNNAIASIYSLRVYANREWEYEYQSAGCETLYGYTAAEIMGDKTLWLSRIPTDDLDAVVMPAFDGMLQGQANTVEFRFCHKEGSLRWISGTYSSRYDEAQSCWIVTGVSFDISDRKQAEAALEREILRRQALLDASFDGIVVLDHSGNVVEANHSFARMLGYSLEQVIGLNVLDWEVQWNAAKLKACQPNHGFSCTFEARHRRQDQSIYDVEICSNGIEWGGEIFRFCVCRDISDRKQAEAALEQARDAAEAANRAKSRFLATMNHELRTPLTAILGFTQLIERSPLLHPTLHDYLRTIQRSGNHLLNLINDILDLAKIEAGRTELNPADFNLQELLHSLYELFRQRAQEKRLEFCLEQPADLPRYCKADSQKLRQVLINLLGNAIKFTEQGRVTLQVGWAPADTPSTCTLRLTVSDTGRGIHPTDQERIFEAFTQLPSGSDVAQGTGLGLTISRNLVQLMGGTISVHSRSGQGSSFQVEIPVEQCTAPVVSATLVDRQVVGLVPGQPTYRVLVVDDQDDNRCLVATLMAQVGLEVRESASGDDAIAQWRQWQPHLIWLDLCLPGLDGWAVARHIRAQSGGQDVVILALTAQTDPSDFNAAIAAGCNGVIHKPFQAATLLTQMEQHLGLQYRYAESDRDPVVRWADPPPDLATLRHDIGTLPEPWKAALHQAAMECASEDMELLIQAIPADQTRLIAGLRRLVHDYAFDKIMQLTQPQDCDTNFDLS